MTCRHCGSDHMMLLRTERSAYQVVRSYVDNSRPTVVVEYVGPADKPIVDTYHCMGCDKVQPINTAKVKVIKNSNH